VGPETTNAADPVAATRIALKSLARRILELGDEIAALDELIEPLVTALAPQLLDRIGIGIEVAGQLLVTAGDNRDRLGSEASFAMLCGVAPLPASSGMTRRHRLNRGGDRQANSALHLAVISPSASMREHRLTWPRRPPRAHSKLEIIRCLKRYLAREVFYLLNAPAGALTKAA
jgi:transposase